MVPFLRPYLIFLEALMLKIQRKIWPFVILDNPSAARLAAGCLLQDRDFS
jgi:hypothetical protein